MSQKEQKEISPLDNEGEHEINRPPITYTLGGITSHVWVNKSRYTTSGFSKNLVFNQQTVKGSEPESVPVPIQVNIHKTQSG